jgi:hypothetical protein
MGQRANNGNRRASLDDKKRRAAGRSQNEPARRAIADRFDEKPAKGQTGGAFGKSVRSERRVKAPRGSRTASKR